MSLTVGSDTPKLSRRARTGGARGVNGHAKSRVAAGSPARETISPVSDTAAVFHSLVGELEYPMFIVTARGDGEPLGCLVGFATQTSIDPPRFAVCLSHKNRTFRGGCDAELLGVHCVPAHAEALVELFGGQTADEVAKFERCAWHEGPGGVPLLDACRNRFVGRVLWRADAGDHELFLLEPITAQAAAGDEQFSFHRARRIDAGHDA